MRAPADFWTQLETLVDETRQVDGPKTLLLSIDFIHWNEGRLRGESSRVRTLKAQVRRDLNALSKNMIIVEYGGIKLKKWTKEAVTMLQKDVEEKSEKAKGIQDSNFISFLRPLLREVMAEREEVEGIRLLRLPLSPTVVHLATVRREGEEAHVELFSRSRLLVGLVSGIQLRRFEETVSDVGELVRESLRELRVDEAAANTPFALLGLDSLQVAVLEKSLCEKGLSLTPGALRKLNSIEKIVKSGIEVKHTRDRTKKEKRKEDVVLKHLKKNPREPIPLSRVQSRLWLLSQIGNSTRFHEVIAFRVHDIRLGSLLVAFRRLQMHHSVLRSVISSSGQSLLSGTECFFVSCSLPPSEAVRFPFSPSSSPPVRLAVYGCVVSVVTHHMVADGLSLRSLIQQLTHIYSNERGLKSASNLLQRPPQYAEYVLREIEANEGDKEREKEKEEWWKKKLHGLEEQLLPTDRPRQAMETFEGGDVRIKLDEKTKTALRKLEKSSGTSPFVIFAALHRVLVYKLSGHRDICMGTTMGNRTTETLHTVGCFVNVLLLRCPLHPSQSLLSWLGDMEKTIDEAKASEDFPFERLLRGLDRDLSTSPLFQLMIVLDSTYSRFPGGEAVEVEQKTSQYEQIWYLVDDGDSISVRVEFNSHLFFRETIEDQVRRLLLLFVQAARNLHVKISDLRLTTRTEEMNAQKIERRDSLAQFHVMQLIEEQKKRKKAVLIEDGRKISFATVEQRSLVLASFFSQFYLRRSGEILTADGVAAVRLQRSRELVSVVLALWSCGLVVVPIAPEWTSERQAQALALLASPLFIDDYILVTQLPSALKRRRFLRSHSLDILYSTFTSGSTGVPKAILMPSAGLPNLIQSYTCRFNLCSRSIVYQTVSIAFDVFFADLLSVLLHGSQLFLASGLIPSVHELSSVTDAYLMPSFLSSLSFSSLPQLCSLNSLFFGGERIDAKVFNALIRLRVRAFQGWGLTEQTVYSSSKRLHSGDLVAQVGTVFPNLRAIVRDEDGHTLPARCLGEAFMSGFLLRGYLGLPSREKNGELPSGDLVKIDSRRGLSFVGRRDDQVKVAGRRLQLLEVVHEIEREESVERCVVLLKEREGGRKELIAYVVLSPQASVDEEKLRELLLSRLPPYLVPQHILHLSEFPLNSNGKIDKKRLPEPTRDEPEGRQPLTHTEKVLVEEFRRELKLSSAPSLCSCFFRLGGDSFVALLLIERIYALWAVRLSLSDFFRLRTVEAIARQVEQYLKKTQREEQKLEFSMRMERNFVVPLSEAQKRFLVLEHLDKESYDTELRFRLKGKVQERRLLYALNRVIISNQIFRLSIFFDQEDNPAQELLSGTEVFVALSPAQSNTSPSFTISFTHESPEESTLYVGLPHGVVDGRSLALIAEQLSFAYSTPLSRIYSKDFVDFCRWESSRDFTKSEHFWKKTLDGFKPTTIPFDDPKNEESNCVERVFSPSLLTSLKTVAARESTSLFGLLSLSFSLLLSSLSKSEDISFGVVVSGRDGETRDIVGPFTNTAILRLPLHLLSSLKDALNALTEMLWATTEQSLPFQNLVDVLQSHRSSSPSPLFDFLLNLQNTSLPQMPSIEGLDVDVETLHPRGSPCPQSWVFDEMLSPDSSSPSLRLHLSYRRFSRRFIEKTVDHFELILRKLTKLPYSSRPRDFLQKENEEEEMLRVWVEVLRKKTLSLEDNFFSSGGTSLLGLSLVSKVRRQLGLDASLTLLFRAPTPRSFLRALQRPSALPLQSSVRDLPEPIDVTPAQVFLLHALSDCSGPRRRILHSSYTISVRLHVRDLKKNCLSFALNRLLLCNAALRCRFVTTEKGFGSEFWSGTEVFLHLSDENHEMALPFDAPSLSVSVSGEEVLLSFSHAIADGHSVGIIARQLSDFYDRRSLLDQKTSPLEYAHHVQELRALMEEEKQRNTVFWMSLLNEFSINRLTWRNSDGAVTCATSITAKGLAEEVRKRAVKEGTSSFVLLLHSLSQALVPLSVDPSKPFAIGFPIDQRRGREWVGMAVHSSFILFSFNDSIKDTTEKVAAAVEHSSLPLPQIVALNEDKEMFDVMLVMDESWKEETGKVLVLDSPPPPTKFPLTFFVREKADDLELEAYFLEGLFEENEVHMVLNEWKRAIQRIPLKNEVAEKADVVTVSGFLVDVQRLRAVLRECASERKFQVTAKDDNIEVVFCGKSDEKLRRRLKERLAPFMLPSIIRFEVERKQRNEENPVVLAVREVLRVADVRAEDDFFQCGGNSLSALRLASLLTLRGLPTTVQLINEHRPLSALVVALSSTPITSTLQPLLKYHADGFPLSEEQRSMAFLSSKDPLGHYQLPFVQRFPSSLGVRRLHAAFHSLLNHQPSLRTMFEETNGELRQFVLSATESYFRPTSVRVDKSEIEKKIMQKSKKRATLREPIRVTVINAGSEGLIVVLVLHHILSDASSTRLVEREFKELLKGCSLPKLDFTYVHYSLEKRPQRDPSPSSLEKIIEALKARRPWQHQVLNISSFALHLPRESRRRVEKKAAEQGGTPFMLFLAFLTRPLHSLLSSRLLLVGCPDANREPKTEGVVGVFLNNLLFVSELCDEDSIENFVNRTTTHVNRVKTENALFNRVISSLRAKGEPVEGRLFDVFLNCRYELEDGSELGELREQKRKEEEVNEFPLEVDVDYEMDGGIRIEVRMENSLLPLTAQELALSMKEVFDEMCPREEEKERYYFHTDKALHFTTPHWSTLSRKFPRGYKALQKHFVISPWTHIAANICKMLSRRVKDPEVDTNIRVNGRNIFLKKDSNYVNELRDLKMTDVHVEVPGLMLFHFACPNEHDLASSANYRDDLFHGHSIDAFLREIVSDLGRRTTRRSGMKRKEMPCFSLPHLFSAQAARTPRHRCLGEDSYLKTERRLVHAALSLRSFHLRATGELLGVDNPVAVVEESSKQTTELCLAVVVSGAVYVPISATSPEHRLLFELSECRVSSAVSSRTLPSTVRCTSPQEIFSSTTCRHKLPLRVSHLSDAAYIIYTSGTTGRPKGVVAVQSSLEHSLLAATRHLNLRSSDRVFQFTQFVFDNSVLEMWMALCVGASLFPSPSPFHVDAFVAAVLEGGVTHALLFPGLVRIFDRRQFSVLSRLRYWVMGAEKADKQLVDKALEQGVTLVQNYGPTETTTYAMSRRMKRGDHPNNIGRPFGGNECRVVDEREKDLPSEVPGQLVLSGPGLMRGYVGRGALGDKYPSGDFVLLRPDDSCVILGRRDGQVKLSGHRVELGEVEGVATECEQVESTKALLVHDSLVLFFTGQATEEQVAEWCVSRLPSFMLPARCVRLQHFPLTKNTKVDTNALIAIYKDKGSNMEEEKTTEGEKNHELKTHNALKKLWVKVLESEVILTPSSHFFLVGGDSFRLLKLRAALKEHMKVDVSVEALLANLQLSHMEALVERSLAPSPHNALIKLDVKENASAALILFHALVGGVTAYSQLVSCLHSSSFSIYGIQHPRTFDGGVQERSVEQLSAVYSSELLFLPHDSFILVGASFGGLIAYETALSIRRQRRVFVVQIDCHARPSLAPRISFKQHMKQMLEVLKVYEVEESMKEGMIRSAWALLQAAYSYSPLHSDLPVAVFSVDSTDLGWADVSSRCTVKGISGNHSTMLDASHSPELALELLDTIASHTH